MIASQIQAIETFYNGYKFRSRLEARWAVFFDKSGIKYRYELEGFKLNGIWYLPDFFIPEWSIWIEVKPDLPTEKECEKAIRLCIARDEPVIILAGDAYNGEFEMLIFNKLQYSKEEIQSILDKRSRDQYCWTSQSALTYWNSDFKEAYPMMFDFDRKYELTKGSWVQCSVCKSIDIFRLGEGMDHKAFCKHKDKPWLDNAAYSDLSLSSPDILASFQAARQARFERQMVAATRQ